MAEHIEREALLNRLKTKVKRITPIEESRDMFYHDSGVNAALTIAMLEVGKAPVADVVPVVWLPVLGFEGLYEVSSLGQLRNKKGEIMKQGIKRTPCTCYKVVRLWKEGTYYTKYVHRLIAEAFIPNPDNLPMINHKDEDGTNNLIGNLEWCTREYNVNYGTAKERRAKKIRGRESEKRVAVIGRTIDGKYEEWFPSIAEAAKVVNGSTSSISKVCKGERKTAYGYRWAYADNHLPQLRSKNGR